MTLPLTPPFTIVPETQVHASLIEVLHERVFGPGRFARTAFRVREGVPADGRFSFIALENERLVGSVRLTPVGIGKVQALLLGPLCVAKPLQGMGIGKALVSRALKAVQETVLLPVILVGDAAYYAPLGFEPAPRGIKMPGPVDYSRLLIAWPDGKAGQSPDDYAGIMRGLSSLAVPHGGKSTE